MVRRGDWRLWGGVVKGGGEWGRGGRYRYRARGE